MLILLEDNDSDVKLLMKSLVEHDIPKKLIQHFTTIDDAQNFIDNLDKRTESPLAIVADVGLKNEIRNGANFIGSQHQEFVTKTGGGVWVFLISRGNLTRGLGLSAALPHASFDKNAKTWHRECAKTVSSLFIDSFQSEEANDLAPPQELRIPLSDRIYLFSSGEARHVTLDDSGSDLVFFSRPQPYYEKEVNPLLMYRGHYIILNHQKEPDVQPHLSRAMLRWRRVALAPSYGDGGTFPRKINARKIHSWRRDGEAMVLDEENGFRLRSIHNVVNRLRTNPQVDSLCRFLFDASKKKLLPAFPSPKKWQSKEIRFDDPFFNQYLLPFPAFVDRDRLSDCFMARLHFVLTDEEIDNYKDWRRDWKELFPDEVNARHPR